MKILLADDNKDFCTTIAEIVGSFGFDTYTLFNPEEVIHFLDRNHKEINCLLLDIEFGPSHKIDGLDILEHSRKNYPNIPVIMISGKGSIETAVKATKLGAINFVEKSIVSKEKIKSVLDSAIDKLGPSGESSEIQSFLEHNGIIGHSRAMINIGDNIIRFGRTDLNIMITGETGTGKKLVAKAIHNISRRNRSPFVTVDIPNIPKDLFQSELFGHTKGSFSGALDNKKGLFHQAHKGTIFLDEMGDMPLELQSNLLLPVEEKSIRKVGAVENEEVDIRFISATDKDLIKMMKEGEFREQLYHRLRECEIYLPPLRERIEDIPSIVDFYLQQHNQQFNDDKFLTPSSIEYLQSQNWEGNIRQLYSVIKVVLQTSRNKQVEISDLHKLIQKDNSVIVNTSGTAKISSDRTLKEDIEEVDKRKIESILDACKGNVSKSAVHLGISRETLHNKIRKYGIDVQLFRAKRKAPELK